MSEKIKVRITRKMGGFIPKRYRDTCKGLVFTARRGPGYEMYRDWSRPIHRLKPDCYSFEAKTFIAELRQYGKKGFANWLEKQAEKNNLDGFIGSTKGCKRVAA